MRVYLCRHGEAVAQAPTDAERPLTERGRLEVMALWQRLREEGVTVDRLIASPYRRAQQTALCIARAYGGMWLTSTRFSQGGCSISQSRNWSGAASGTRYPHAS